MRILITNDDGIHSEGLHVLARAMKPFGDVVIAAPDSEYSGASSAIGALWDMDPHVTRHQVDGIDEAWALNGPPALCVFYARLGLFGDPFDLVVSGINPGANVGRSIYHSGTIGACLTARNGGISGVAVSQAFPHSYEGQAINDIVALQIWDTAAMAAQAFVGGLIAEGLPSEPLVANINVPNLPISEVKGWKQTTIGLMPPGTLTTAEMVATDDPDTYKVSVAWEQTGSQNQPGTDGYEVMDGYVSVSYLGRIAAIDHPEVVSAAHSLSELVADAND